MTVLAMSAVLAIGQEEEEEDLDLSLSLWDKSITLRGALGYKDNVLLSSAHPEGSAFWQTALDVTVFRLSLDGGVNFTYFLTAEDRRYFSSDEIEKEQLLLTQAKLEKPIGDDWVASATLQYLYADQVYDASATELILETLPVKSHNVQFSPGITRNLPWNSALELKFTLERQYFNEPLDDYWEYGPQLAFTKKYGNRSEASLSYTFDQREYDQRREVDLDFFAVEGTSLAYEQHEFEFDLNHSWDEERRWRSRLRFVFELNDDNATGFYDYNRYRLSKRFGYYAENWQATVEGKILHYDYDRQPVFEGTGIRSTWEYVLAGHVHKRIWKQMNIFADTEYDIAESNYALEEYTVWTLMGGIDWEF